MPKVEPREVWKARAKLRIQGLALALQYVERGRGSKIKRHIAPTDWLAKDGETILIDVGKKLKGWFKEQMKTLKPSMVPKLQYGLVCKSLPTSGFVPIAKLSNISKETNWDTFAEKESYELGDLPKPNADFVVTPDGRNVTSCYYVLENPIEVEVVIQSFAAGVHPDAVKDWLESLGPIRGLGDKHSAGFGTFELLEFKEVERKELTF